MYHAIRWIIGDAIRTAKLHSTIYISITRRNCNVLTAQTTGTDCQWSYGMYDVAWVREVLTYADRYTGISNFQREDY